MRKLKSLLLVSASCGTLLASHCAAWSQAATAIELPPIQVEGDQVGSAVKTAYEVRQASPNSKIVIEAEQLNQFNDLSIGDAIRRLPGVTFPGVNRSREIKLRGLPGVYTRVLLDGRPLIDGDSGRNMEVDRIPASFIERVEIIRNPLATGDSQGAAGTVNIITKRNFGPSGSGGGVTLGGGYVQNFKDTGEGSIWQGGKFGKLNYFIGGGYQRRLLEESINTTRLQGAVNGNQQDQKRRFDEQTFLGRFEYAADAFNSFVVAPTYMRTEELREQIDTRAANATPFRLDRNTVETRYRARENVGSYFEWTHALTSNTQVRTFFDIQKATETTTRISSQRNFNASGIVTSASNGFSYVPIDLYRYAPGVAATTQFGNHKLEYGIGLNRLTRDETTIGTNARTYKIGENIFYGYLSDSFGVFGNGDLLTLGARFEHSVTDTTDYLGASRTSKATDFNPSLQYRLPLATNVDLRLGASRTLRRPDLRDLSPTLTTNSGTYTSPDTRGNPELAPERIWGFDGGVDLFLFDRSGLLALNLFRRNFDNKIETTLSVENSRYISSSRNVGSGSLNGMEAEARIPLTFIGLPNLSIWGNVTVLQSEMTDPLTGQTRRFAEQPNTLSNLGFDYYVPEIKTTFGVNANRVFSYNQDIAQLTGGLPPAASTTQIVRTEFNTLDKLDFSIRTQLSKDWTVTFAALNLLRPIDRRTITTYSNTGAVVTQQLTEQASHSTYYVRTTYTW